MANGGGKKFLIEFLVDADAAVEGAEQLSKSLGGVAGQVGETSGKVAQAQSGFTKMGDTVSSAAGASVAGLENLVTGTDGVIAGMEATKEMSFGLRGSLGDMSSAGDSGVVTVSRLAKRFGFAAKVGTGLVTTLGALGKASPLRSMLGLIFLVDRLDRVVGRGKKKTNEFAIAQRVAGQAIDALGGDAAKAAMSLKSQSDKMKVTAHLSRLSSKQLFAESLAATDITVALKKRSQAQSAAAQAASLEMEASRLAEAAVLSGTTANEKFMATHEDKFGLAQKQMKLDKKVTVMDRIKLKLDKLGLVVALKKLKLSKITRLETLKELATGKVSISQLQEKWKIASEVVDATHGMTDATAAGSKVNDLFAGRLGDLSKIGGDTAGILGQIGIGGQGAGAGMAGAAGGAGGLMAALGPIALIVAVIMLAFIALQKPLKQLFKIVMLILKPFIMLAKLIGSALMVPMRALTQIVRTLMKPVKALFRGIGRLAKALMTIASPILMISEIIQAIMIPIMEALTEVIELIVTPFELVAALFRVVLKLFGVFFKVMFAFLLWPLKLLGMVLKPINKAMKALSPIINALLAPIMEMGKAFDAVFGEIGDLIGQIVTPLIDDFLGPLKDIFSFAKGLFGVITQAILWPLKLVMGVIKFLMPVFKLLFKIIAIGAMLATGGLFAVIGVVMLIWMVVKNLGTIIKFVFGWVKTVVSTLGAALWVMLTPIRLIWAAFGFLWEIGKKVFNAMSVGAKIALGMMFPIVGIVMLIGKLIEWWKFVFTTMIKVAQFLFSVFVAGFKLLFSPIKLITGAFRILSSVMGGVWKAISWGAGLAAKALGFVVKPFKWIVDGAKKVWSWLFGSGLFGLPEALGVVMAPLKIFSAIFETIAGVVKLVGSAFTNLFSIILFPLKIIAKLLDFVFGFLPGGGGQMNFQLGLTFGNFFIAMSAFGDSMVNAAVSGLGNATAQAGRVMSSLQIATGNRVGADGNSAASLFGGATSTAKIVPEGASLGDLPQVNMTGRAGGGSSEPGIQQRMAKTSGGKVKVIKVTIPVSVELDGLVLARAVSEYTVEMGRERYMNEPLSPMRGVEKT